MKRLVISSTLGLVFGFVCYAFASSNVSMPLPLAVSIILSRMLIGFSIGISRFSMKHWSIHGVVMGLLLSLPGGFGAMSNVEGTGFTPSMMFFSTVIMGIVYGFLIELITTVLFKAKQVKK